MFNEKRKQHAARCPVDSIYFLVLRFILARCLFVRSISFSPMIVGIHFGYALCQ